MSDPRAEQAIAYIREQITSLEARIAELRASANTVARSAGLPVPYPEKRAPTPSVGRRADSTPALSPFESIAELAVARVPEPGQFRGLSLPEGVLAYFEWRGRSLGAVSIDDLLHALVLGGVPKLARDEDSKERLRELLGRDKRFGRLRNGYYGLADWLNKTKPPSE